MSIAAEILRAFPNLSDAQKAVVGHGDGPLLVIAGPGSGKTYSLVLRALNLLLLGKAEPRELVICTFTEKAAFGLRDRISSAAARLGYGGDLSELRVSTIHGLCNRLLQAHRHRTPLGNNYETLDELTQLLFIFENFEELVPPQTDGRYLGRWQTKWNTIEGLSGYFNKITEELVDPERLAGSSTPFLHALGTSYLAYRQRLMARNRLDFAHQQKFLHDLLHDPVVGPAVIGKVRYLLVDEYQDTNYIQEQILLKLSEGSGNICVVGDEDQSLYRFRGATVRNILEFAQRLPGCSTVSLTTNYRSHRTIVEKYARWMASADWSNPAGLPYGTIRRIR
ncbi:MAG: UvrD-helicase domain-containing protein [Candidatus Methylomirabilia bacterium]